jgi:hypothetical protein
MVNATPRPIYPGKDPVPILWEAGWTPGSVWMGAENLAPTGIRSPDRPVRSESLYRLSYLGRHELAYVMIPVPHLYALNPDDGNNVFPKLWYISATLPGVSVMAIC